MQVSLPSIMLNYIYLEFLNLFHLKSEYPFSYYLIETKYIIAKGNIKLLFRLTLLQDSCNGSSEIIDHSKHDATTLYRVSFNT
jgi:hypothetical protein